MNGSIVAGATRVQSGVMPRLAGVTNFPIGPGVLSSGATLSAVALAPFLDTAGRVETLFLSTLSRRPRADEAERMVAYVHKGGATGDRQAALGDIFWALLNSPEFLLNH
jgi:hypothetical protein